MKLSVCDKQTTTAMTQANNTNTIYVSSVCLNTLDGKLPRPLLNRGLPNVGSESNVQCTFFWKSSKCAGPNGIRHTGKTEGAGLLVALVESIYTLALNCKMSSERQSQSKVVFTKKRRDFLNWSALHWGMVSCNTLTD